ncbi:hypothetical protein [Histidinibacterium aquaticum]|uniref:Uncharacterized protein n=1 Tax=Histidinibacterium aquaticum TaxID=2613962 RepID=A0A5J5GQ24_9RHOB|nr:hypothetical protein [Histidinibacterium aquaticum]KAA9010157.1 hypothetical protein F3S47_02585 [Histidinibacterium aquaticum]
MTNNDLIEARARLAQFAGWTNTEAPASLVDADGAPTDELLQYSDEQELCLDWLFAGDVRPLALAFREHNEAMSQLVVQRRVDMLAGLAGMEPVPVQAEDHGAARLTDELIDFCREAGGDLDWLMHGCQDKLVKLMQRSKLEDEHTLDAVRGLSRAELSALTATLRIALADKLNVEQVMATYRQVVEEQRAA